MTNCRDRWGVAEALRGLGGVAWNVGRFDEAEVFLRESVSISEELGDDMRRAVSLNHLALIALHHGEFEAAEQMQRRNLAIYRRAGQRLRVVELEAALAIALYWQGKLSEARLLLEGALSVDEERGFPRGIARRRSDLGVVAVHLGEYDAARDYLQDSLLRWQAMDNQRGVGFRYEDLGALALTEENYVDAEELLQHALSTFRGIDQRTFEARTLAKLAYVARGEGAQAEARQYVTKALYIANDVRTVLPLFDALPAAALVLAGRGEPIHAVEIYALATHRFGLVRNSHWFADVAGRHIESVKATLPADVVTATETRGCERDLWETVAELLVELSRDE